MCLSVLDATPRYTKKHPSPYYVSEHLVTGTIHINHDNKAIYIRSATRDVTKMVARNPNSLVQLRGKYNMTASSRIYTAPFLILHYVLEGIDVRGSPAVLLAQYLQPYFRDRLLAYEEVVFSVSTEEEARRHERSMTTLIRKYSR
jgi:hypothetical protein